MTRDEVKTNRRGEKSREDFRGVNLRKFPSLAALSKIDFYYLSGANIQTHIAYKVSGNNERCKEKKFFENKHKEQNEFLRS